MSLFGDVIGIIDAGRASKAISTQYNNAENGVVQATKSGQAGIQGALGAANTNVNAAGQNVNAATASANGTLADYLKSIQGNLAPSIASGAQGNTALQAYAASNPQFHFDPSTYLNSDAMKFQQQQGSEGITNAASAQGLGASGNTLKALDQYNQGVASTYYNQAETQAQNQFQINQNTTLANLQALINSGQAGNALNLSATNSLGAPQAQNTINASTTNASLQQFLASLGLQGNEFGANFGLQGAKTAGDFAVGQGNAQASGILGQGAALSNIGSDLMSTLAGIPGLGGH